jgi:opine dehydrogenase
MNKILTGAAIWLSAVIFFDRIRISLAFQDRCFGNYNFGVFRRRTRDNSNAILFFSKKNDDYNNNNPSSLKIGIAGAGAIAFGTASILSKNGYDNVMLWSPSGAGTINLVTTADDDGDDGGDEREQQRTIISTGALQHEFLPQIVSNAQQLVNESDILIVALPANGHKNVFDALIPHLSSSCSNKHILISSHSSLGALYLSQYLYQLNNDHRHTITSWGTTVCTARRLRSSLSSGRTVDIKTIRKSVDTCCIPEEDSSISLALCRQLFPKIDFRPRDGLLAISLSNLNPQNHLAISLGNISRMDKGEDWYQFQHITPSIGRFLETLDKERLDIATALGLDVKTIYEHFSLSFHVPIPESRSISEMCQEIYKLGNDVYGPNKAESRYVTEDVPFGLTLIVALGKLVGRPAVLHESGLLVCNSMYGRDFAAENDLLQALDLDQIKLSDLKEAARTGRISTSSSTYSV